MKSFRAITAMLFCAVIFVIPSFSQTGGTTPTQPKVASAPAKVALINSGAFGDEKVGIKRLVNSLKQLDTEFKVRLDELVSLDNRIKALKVEIQKLQNVPQVDQKTIDAKMEEGERLTKEFNRKKEDYEQDLGKREQALIGPIQDDIFKALTSYAKEKGYTLVLELGALYKAQSLVYFDGSANITDEFITYYNTRPAGASTPTRPATATATKPN